MKCGYGIQQLRQVHFLTSIDVKYLEEHRRKRAQLTNFL